LRWALVERYFLLLKPVRVRGVILIALQTQSKIVALLAVKAVHKLRYCLHAVIAAVP
jgi:hypothetical protein